MTEVRKKLEEFMLRNLYNDLRLEDSVLMILRIDFSAYLGLVSKKPNLPKS